MAVAKGNKSSPCSVICYKVRYLTEPILDATQIGYIEDRYSLGEQLEKGQSGVVRICLDRQTGEKWACKSIAKDKLETLDDVESVKLEMEIMARLSDHPNVVGLKAVFEDDDYVHLVMELCSGGDLYHMSEENGRFSEKEAVVFFKQLMEVVMYCHEKGVVHRDLKPENILLATTEMSSPIRLADFGLANYIKPGQSLSGRVGSPFYIAPEVLCTGVYDQAVDVWSAGVILYILLSRVPPFSGDTKAKIFDQVKAAELAFPSDPWDEISRSAKDLIAGMLHRDPSKRLTAEEVLDHRWMKNQEVSTRESSPQEPLCMSNGCAGLTDTQQEHSPVFTRQSSFSLSMTDDEDAVRRLLAMHLGDVGPLSTRISVHQCLLHRGALLSCVPTL